MIAIAKTYLLSIIEWKAKKLIKAIISPIEDDEEPPSKPERSSKSSNSSPAQTAPAIPTPAPVVTQPVQPKYQNPPSHRSSSGVRQEDFVVAIIKVACVLVIGTVILNSVVSSLDVNNSSAFSGVFARVQANIQTGYALAALMVLVVGAGAIMKFLGFM